jgi:hypothetical protein
MEKLTFGIENASNRSCERNSGKIWTEEAKSRVTGLRRCSQLSTSRQCKFYRRSGTMSMGRGYCDLDCDQTTCDGDIDFCEKPSSLRTYFFEQLKRGGSLSWEIGRKTVHFSGGRKA